MEYTYNGKTYDNEKDMIRDMTIDAELEELKHFLSSTDYQVIKHLEGQCNDQAFATVKAKREEARQRIKALEAMKETN